MDIEGRRLKVELGEFAASINVPGDLLAGAKQQGGLEE
jgi:hypothetical protein